MSLELTEEQWHALEGETPPRVTNPATKITYVLIREDLYKRLQGLLTEEEFDPSETYPAVDRAFTEGWNDPKMDDYDRYEDLRSR